MRIAIACLFLAVVAVLPLMAEAPTSTATVGAQVAGFLASLDRAASCPAKSVSAQVPDTSKEPSVLADAAKAPSAQPPDAVKAPLPARRLSEVDCDQCGGGTHSPGFQCNQMCRREGLCVDQCYADSGTCQLVTCICLLC
jgi:hypothetical protein